MKQTGAATLRCVIYDVKGIKHKDSQCGWWQKETVPLEDAFDHARAHTHKRTHTPVNRLTKSVNGVKAKKRVK